MILYRIATETRTRRADDLSGAGAAISPGRWNDFGEAVVYAAPGIALAMLETAAHLDDGGLPLNRFLVAIDVPDAAWKKRLALKAADLPATWSAVPAGTGSVQAGSGWFRAGAHAVLDVPSVIVPEESVIVLNPAHADLKAMKAKVLRAIEYGKLFRGA